MKIIENISELNAIPKGCSLTIGNFDGLHIGHAKILSTARQLADKRKTRLAVMTFDPHPVAVLHPEMAPERLATALYKLHLLEKNGSDFVFLVKDRPQFLNLSPKDFIEQFLCRALKPAVVIEGDNFQFGKNRSGDIHTLTNLGAEFGFEVISVPSASVSLSSGADVKISSTIIRNLLSKGSVADAALCLGRPYKLIGKIVPGKGKGRTLGFPTANLALISQLIPALGVYAATAQIAEHQQETFISEQKIPAAISIGTSQTFGPKNPLLVEAHLLEENVPVLTGRWIALDFIDRIRDQKKFDSEKELAEYIAADCQKISQILTQKVL
jgi:riboflavin kinase/FMN adenylyltransferase